jgi:geranylgeranyl diphosphate synthase type I
VQGLARRSAILDSDHASATRGAVSARLRELLRADRGGVYELAAYHLGWRDESGRAVDGGGGKMLRPLICVTGAAGYGDARNALDAACAIELLHAFSLVHDDIEDGDVRRRHRPTLWALHGMPLALNAGDALFALAYRTLHGAIDLLAPEAALAALRIFDEACLRMIEGQHADLEFESLAAVSLDDYLAMSAGKTGALLGASLGLGALFGGAPACDVDRLLEAGREAGLAFQAVDDALAVWGDAARTGKAVGNDVARGKKSLPALIAEELCLPVGHELVRAAVMRMAHDRADGARRLVGETSMATEQMDELSAVIDFMVQRES